MKGPITVVQGSGVPGLTRVGSLHQWSEGAAYLHVDHVRYQGVEGAVFTYYNPPVHQMGNPALIAYLAGFEALQAAGDALRFVLLVSSADPVHAGGDLKESLGKLTATLEARKALEAKGAPAAEIDALYQWGDARLERGLSLYLAVRSAARTRRTVAVCAGGTRFGGSAEVMLLGDVLVGDSRSGMCFSEAQIGLIPGWGGVGRAVTKAGPEAARRMATLCPIVAAPELLTLGLYDQVVTVDRAFPRMTKLPDGTPDKAAYAEALQANEEATLLALLPAALDAAIAPAPPARAARPAPGDAAALAAEVARRSDPETYRDLWGQSLKDAAEPLKTLGRPLAPQSVEKLEALFASTSPDAFDEEAFVRLESRLDAELYRDPRFLQGIRATLDQTVADFTKGK